MKRVAIASVLGVLLCSGCKAPEGGLRSPAGAPPPGPLRLEFSPAAGKTLREKTTTVRTERFTTPDRQERPFRESVEAKLVSRFEQGTGGNWLITQRVESVQARGNDEVIQNKLMDLVTRIPMKVEIAPDGTFVRYVNTEDAEAAVRSVFGDQAEAVLPYFSARALEEQARREWEQKYGGLFRRALEPGQTVSHTVESVGLASGTQLAYALERRVVGPVATPYGPGVALELRCLGTVEGPGKETLTRQMAERGVEALEPTVQCEGRQELAGEPFVPVSLHLRLTARPQGAEGGSPVEILFEKTNIAERLE
ncbi:MAG TPA: hypothetical protein VK447_08835 [Myxococcaceae bacterium]|nr:hypothetical protein [Myxococcaceae bacterium]